MHRGRATQPAQPSRSVPARLRGSSASRPWQPAAVVSSLCGCRTASVLPFVLAFVRRTLDASGAPFPLDMRVELDDTAKYRSGAKWNASPEARRCALCSCFLYCAVGHKHEREHTREHKRHGEVCSRAPQPRACDGCVARACACVPACPCVYVRGVSYIPPRSRSWSSRSHLAACSAPPSRLCRTWTRPRAPRSRCSSVTK